MGIGGALMDVAIIFATPLVLAVLGAVIARLRRLSWRDDLGFRPPSAKSALLWLGAFLVLGVAAEFASRAMGVDDPGGEWRGKYDAVQLAIRIAAIGLVYPVAEEFFFRGALLGMIRRRFGDLAGILGSAAVFALAHVQYDWRSMALIFVDALFFAVCRLRGGSLYLVMFLHILGNSYAIWQRLYG